MRPDATILSAIKPIRGDTAPMKPVDIYRIISKDIIGQDDMLKYVSVAIFKHVAGEKFGNLLLIGNSGTGKTATMQAMERMYNTHPFFEKHRVVLRMNANTFANDEGMVLPHTHLYHQLENRALTILGKNATPEQVRELVEHATVCIDEIDKITARIGGKPNVVGINIQQSLLTLMEGEEITYNTKLFIGGEYKEHTFRIDTGNMLFICGGAFEELFDQVYSRVFEEGKQEKLTKMTLNVDGAVEFKQIFTLKENLEQLDIFNYGMLPQFIARFDNAVVLNDLTPNDLLTIFMDTPTSVFKHSKRFFEKFDVELSVTEKARKLIAYKAAENSRVGARALKDIYGRIIKRFEFDPHNCPEVQKFGDRYELTIDETIVKRALGIK